MPTYDDNPLYNLGNAAALAGMAGFDDFQDQSGGVDPEFDATLRDVAPDEGDERLSHLFTKGGDGLPSYVDQGIMGGSLAAPESVQVEQSAVLPDSMKTGSSVGVSASGRGFSQEKAKQIDKRDKLLNRDLAAADATAQSQFAGAQPALDTAKESAMSAAESITGAQVQKITGEALAAQRLAEINTQFAMAEEEINAHYTSKQNQAQADYVQALSDFRASRVDPNQLWKDMSGGERFGTLVAAFAHDYLGSKGIKTSAMQSINMAIDRNIAAQEYAIKTKGEVTQGFKTLWDMQRAQSQSDAEARGRVRGFMLESVKQGITANMAQYEAGLATAQGQAALAKIDEAYAQNLIEVYKEIAKNTAQLRGQAIQWNAQKLDAANAAWANSLRSQELNFQKKKYEDEKNKADAIKAGDFVVDPETGKNRWVFKPGVSEKTKDRVKEAMEGTAEVNEVMKEIRALAAETGSKPDLLYDTRVMNQKTRQIEAMRVRLAHAMVKANGEKATDKDVQQYLKSLPVETWLTNGGVDEILAYTHKTALKPAEFAIQQHTFDVPEGAQIDAPKTRPFEGAATDAENAGRKEPDSIVKEANKALTRPDQNEKATKADLDKVRNLTKVEPMARFKEFNRERKAPRDMTKTDAVVIGLADEARGGNMDALTTLEKWAETHEMARWEMMQIRDESTVKPKDREYRMAQEAGIIPGGQSRGDGSSFPAYTGPTKRKKK